MRDPARTCLQASAIPASQLGVRFGTAAFIPEFCETDGIDSLDNGRGGVMGDADRDEVPNRFDVVSRFYDAGATSRHVQWEDFDRDVCVTRRPRPAQNPRRY